MRTIDVTFHIVEPASAQFGFPAAELRELYLSAGIDLNFIAGHDITPDPANHPASGYPVLVEKFRTSATTSGHLIIGSRTPIVHSDWAGQLLDQTTRGVSAVYTQSDYIQSTGAVGLLQTCAHELGHMLNLAHEDISPEYASVMNQADSRTSDIENAWIVAGVQAARIVSQSNNPYFTAPSGPLNCYPFAYAARLRLNTSSEDSLLPWRGVFERTYDGTNDRY